MLVTIFKSLLTAINIQNLLLVNFLAELKFFQHSQGLVCFFCHLQFELQWKKVSTSTEVGGGVKYLTAISDNNLSSSYDIFLVKNITKILPLMQCKNI